MSDPVAHHLLIYTYVDDMAERRGPHRSAHLERIQAAKDAGTIIMAGALGTPPTGGAMVWKGATVDEIEAFADGDPYQAAGLITARRIEPWTLV